jgi:hypothetical protein
MEEFALEEMLAEIHSEEAWNFGLAVLPMSSLIVVALLASYAHLI